jgi:hypothetical protein
MDIMMGLFLAAALIFGLLSTRLHWALHNRNPCGEYQGLVSGEISPLLSLF